MTGVASVVVKGCGMRRVVVVVAVVVVFWLLVEFANRIAGVG